MRDILLVYIIYITMTLIPGSSCKECGSYKDDDKAAYSDELVTIMEPYCFVNECMIRIEESDELLNVINNTGDWIIATNMTNLFTIFANDSTTDCSSDTTNRFDTSVYVIQNIIYSVAIIAMFTNVIMHLMFKELHTVAGALIIILCISLGNVIIFDAIYISLIYYQINIREEICATYIYFSVISVNIHQATKISVLAHFGYTMYRSYKLLGVQHNVRLWLCKYITFITGASAVCSTIVITLDATVNRQGFHTSDGKCIPFFDTSDRDGIQLSMVNVLYFGILLIWLLLKLILATIGIVLYFLTTRRCCITSTSKDFRVFIILTITVDFNIIIFILLLVNNVSTSIFMAVLSTSAAIEQVTLLVLFGSSSKVMCCCTQGRKCYSNCNCMESPHASYMNN